MRYLVLALCSAMPGCAGAQTYEPVGSCLTNEPRFGCANLKDDMDGDGIADAEDNCPHNKTHNVTDYDVDGVGDYCDNCVDVPNSDQADEDGDHFGNECDTGENVPTMISLQINKDKPLAVRRFRLPAGNSNDPMIPIIIDAASSNYQSTCIHVEGYSLNGNHLVLETPDREVKGVTNRSRVLFQEEVVVPAHAVRYDLHATNDTACTFDEAIVLLEVDIGMCVYSVGDPPTAVQNGPADKIITGHGMP